MTVASWDRRLSGLQDDGADDEPPPPRPGPSGGYDMLLVCSLETIYTRPAQRGRGYGAALVTAELITLQRDIERIANTIQSIDARGHLEVLLVAEYDGTGGESIVDTIAMRLKDHVDHLRETDSLPGELSVKIKIDAGW